jgi:PAS domain S-box-containing protein
MIAPREDMAFHRAPIALLEVEPGGTTIRRANAAFESLTGNAASEVMGRDAVELLIGRADAEASALRALFRGERPDGIEATLRRRDGSAIVCACTASSGNGSAPTIVAFRDVRADRERQDREVRARSLAAIARLVSGVAHELNNPLTGVIGFSEVLLVDEDDASKREALERIVQEGQRVARIVRDLLIFARRQRLRKVEADLNETIAAALESCRTASTRPGNVTYELEIEKGIPPFLFDPDQVRDVVKNLIRNGEDAVAGMGRPGVVRVRTRAAGERAYVEVEDDGPGVREADRDRLFFPFFTTKQVGLGTGLGLAVAYGIALEHGGDLAYAPAEPRGARFILELPIVRPEPAPATPGRVSAAVAATADSGDGAQGGRGARILVIDDEASVRAFLRSALRVLKHEVTEATSAEEALAHTRASEFDVILLDLRMPGIGGEGFFDTLLREQPQLKNRVIFQTGDTVSLESLRFIEKSNRPLLAKPYTIQDLQKAIAAVIVATAAEAGIARPPEV